MDSDLQPGIETLSRRTITASVSAGLISLPALLANGIAYVLTGSPVSLRFVFVVMVFAVFTQIVIGTLYVRGVLRLLRHPFEGHP